MTSVQPPLYYQKDVDQLEDHIAKHVEDAIETLPITVSLDKDDPHSWSKWRKNSILAIVCLHTMLGTFSSSVIIPAFMQLSNEFDVSLNKTAFLVSVSILLLGTFPLIWTPISHRIGRRPVYLISAFLSAVCTLAGVFCHSYGSLMVSRALLAIFISPPLSLGACTVREMFQPEEYGEKMGVWSLMVTIGPLLGPIMLGFLIQDRGWRAAFDFVAAMQLALFFAHLLFGHETLTSNRDDRETPNTTRSWYWFFIYRNEPIRIQELLRPFYVGLQYPTVFLPSVAIALVFCHTNVFVTVYVPKIFGAKFGLTPGQIGLQIIAQLIGAVIGETLTGRGSDAFMNWRTKKTGKRVPEDRLLLVYPGFICAVVGLIVWGVQLQNAKKGHWNITPDIGAAIAVFGQQIVSSICTTYAIETYTGQTGHVSSFVSFVRQLMAFIGPFYLGDAIDNLGTAKACELFSGLMALGGLMNCSKPKGTMNCLIEFDEWVLIQTRV